MKKRFQCLIAFLIICLAAASFMACDSTSQMNSGDTAAAADNDTQTEADAETGGNDGSSQIEDDPAPQTLASTDESGVLEIGEKLFVEQMNDIYYNPEDYFGKTIRYEGYYMRYSGEEPGTSYSYIIRNGPGCCGIDDIVGFEIRYDGEFPKVDDWVKVTGVVESYEEDGWDYIRLAATEIEVLPERGNDTVTEG